MLLPPDLFLASLQLCFTSYICNSSFSKSPSACDYFYFCLSWHSTTRVLYR